MDAPPTTSLPRVAASHFDERAEVRVAFLGRLPGLSTEPSTGEAARDAFAACCATGLASPAINRQVHSSRVIRASRAPEEADGLFDPGPVSGPPLAIFTADCVPVLLGVPGGGIAALHAGWRGLAGGVISEGVSRFADRRSITAWIGPAIGSCCYEVDDDVALAVAQCSNASVIRPGRRGRPHLDLERAARLQLEAAGVRDVRVMRCCTRCDRRWHSYRREGPGRGRNHAFIWRHRDGAAGSL